MGIHLKKRCWAFSLIYGWGEGPIISMFYKDEKLIHGITSLKYKRIKRILQNSLEIKF